MSRISKDIAGYFPPSRTGRIVGGQRRLTLRNLAGWLPLMILPATVWLFKERVAPWVFMWALAFAIFFGCKWLTWWRCLKADVPLWRNVAYLLAWPGMDAETFLDANKKPSPPLLWEWMSACVKTILGTVLVWKVAREIPSSQSLAQGWIGLWGLVLLLHFGSFQLLALAWRRVGVDAEPLMQSPLMATSVADFWGRRWNSAFNRLVHELLFRKLYRVVGTGWAIMAVFFVSGLIHDLLISAPARGGYGLPTFYFLIQGAALLFERSDLGRVWLNHGMMGRPYTILATAGPAFWLFHPQFIKVVILPMLRCIGAT